MRSSAASSLVRDVYLYRTSLPGSRLRAKLRPAKVRDEDGAPLASVVVRAGGGRWLARVVGAAAFTAAVLLLMSAVGSMAGAAWIVGLAVPVLLLASLVLVVWVTPEPGYALLSDAGDTLLLVEPESRWGASRRSRVEDGEGRRLGALLRAPLRDRFWPLGHAAPLIVVEPTDGTPVTARRPSAWAAGWRFEEGQRPIARYAIGTLPGARDRLEVGDTSIDRRLLLAAVLVGRP